MSRLSGVGWRARNMRSVRRVSPSMIRLRQEVAKFTQFGQIGRHTRCFPSATRGGYSTHCPAYVTNLMAGQPVQGVSNGLLAQAGDLLTPPHPRASRGNPNG